MGIGVDFGAFVHGVGRITRYNRYWGPWVGDVCLTSDFVEVFFHEKRALAFLMILFAWHGVMSLLEFCIYHHIIAMMLNL